MLGFGWTELVIIALILLLLFGEKTLPKLARNLGKAAKDLKNRFF